MTVIISSLDSAIYELNGNIIFVKKIENLAKIYKI